MSEEQELTAGLERAAAIAADLAGQIGESDPSAASSTRSVGKDAGDKVSLDEAADLDTQLSQLQDLVSKTADGATVADSAGNREVEAIGESMAPGPAISSETPLITEPQPPSRGSENVLSCPAPGIVGNIREQPALQPPSKPEPAEEPPQEPQRLRFQDRARSSIAATGYRVGDSCVRFLEIINEPFQFVGMRLRILIGWVAIATIGASILVAAAALFL